MFLEEVPIVPAPTPQQRPQQPNRRPSLSFFMSALRSQAQSPIRQPISAPVYPSPVQGMPRIFHPSPLNPNPPANPIQAPQRSPVIARSPIVPIRPQKGRIIPLPSLTFASIAPRPKALPPSEAAGDGAWTPTQEGMEEYASDHPQDLVERAWEMEERDELERVKHWAEDVFIASFALVEGEGPEDEALPVAGGDEFWQREKPAIVPAEKLMEGLILLADEVVPLQLPVDDISPTPDGAQGPPLAIVAPTPDNRSPAIAEQQALARLASPYPAPPAPEFDLDSSSSSSKAGPAELAVQSHLTVPLTTRKSFMSLTSPSPFSGLPSPFRLPNMTPITPFWPLKSENQAAYPTPPAQEPLPPIFPAPNAPAIVAPDSRVPSVLDRISSYLGSAASPRPPSPETPPRIVHESSAERRAQAAAEEELPSRTRTRSRSSSSERTHGQSVTKNRWGNMLHRTETGSTGSRALSRSARGRSPTRRSWKATSERAATRVGVGILVERVGNMERAQLVQPVLIQQKAEAANARAAETIGSWRFSTSDVEVERQRTPSKSRSRSRYSVRSSAAPTPQPPRPDTQASVMTADLFYNPQSAPPPIVETSNSVTPDTLKPEGNHSTSGSLTRGPQPGMSPSILRRRKSHRAQKSAVSLPSSNEGEEAMRPVEGVLSKREPSVHVPEPIVLASTKPSTTTSPETPVILGLPTSSSLEAPPIRPLNRIHPIAAQSAAASSPTSTPTLAFLKFFTLLSQFQSDLSTDRRGVPRWKHDFADAEEKIRVVYDNFREATERSRVAFRPWLRENEHSQLREDDEEDEGKVLMYVEDLWAKMECRCVKS